MSNNEVTQKHTILVVDDDASILQVLETRLISAGYNVCIAANGEEALERMGEHSVDLVLSDVKMPGMNGCELLGAIKSVWPTVPVILLTAYGRIPEAVELVQKGAADYLTKPFDGKELLAKVQSLLALNPLDKSAALERTKFQNIGLIFGESFAMNNLLAMIKKVAPSDATVLLEGESGTGKELFARLVHSMSTRAEGPLIVVDCGSTQPSLLESELFGHVKGAFTHAVRDKQGLIQAAHKGSLFLDEIGNISSEMQMRLLRVLQEKTIRKIGEVHTVSVDCRVIAATNADLPAMVQDGSFREDLYYRLKVVRLRIPPLRERQEDIPMLVDHFLAMICKESGLRRPELSAAASDRLMNYFWPGNVRELRHVLEAAVLMCSNAILRPEDFSLEERRTGAEKNVLSMEEKGWFVGGSGTDSRIEAETTLSLDESERMTIQRALEKANWVQKDAAALLGISKRAIHYKIRKYGIKIPARGAKFQP